MRYYCPRHAATLPLSRARSVIWVIVTFTWPALRGIRVISGHPVGDAVSNIGAGATCGLAVAGRVLVRRSWRRFRSPVLAASVAEDARRAREQAEYAARRIAGYDRMWAAAGGEPAPGRPALTVLRGGR